ncbi:MAG: hypothetical protein WCE38_03470, partial [Burkholderiales bacterium]
PPASRAPLLEKEGIRIKTAAAFFAACLLAGCAVGPEYARPKIDTPDAWRIAYTEAAEVANTR